MRGEMHAMPHRERTRVTDKTPGGEQGMVVGAKKKEREHKRAARGKRGPDTRKVGPIAGLADFPDFPELDHVLRR